MVNEIESCVPGQKLLSASIRKRGPAPFTCVALPTQTTHLPMTPESHERGMKKPSRHPNRLVKLRSNDQIGEAESQHYLLCERRSGASFPREDINRPVQIIDYEVTNRTAFLFSFRSHR